MTAMTSNKRFAIIGHYRAGASMVQSHLYNHPKVMSFGEILSSRSPSPLWQYTECDATWNITPVLALRALHPMQFIDAVYHLNYRPLKTHIGIMFLHDNFDGCPSEVWDYVKELPIVHVVRHNAFHEYVSACIAKWRAENGMQPHARQAEDTMKTKIIEMTMTVEELEDYFKSRSDTLKKYVAPYRNLASYHVVYYEDLIKNIHKEMAKIMEFLDLPVIKTVSPFHKIVQIAYKEFVKNYDELRDYFKKTQWEIYFDE